MKRKVHGKIDVTVEIKDYFIANRRRREVKLMKLITSTKKDIKLDHRGYH